MRLLLPTGSATAATVRRASEGYDAQVEVTGEIASFLTPEQLLALIREGTYDLVLVSGMCTASFGRVEKETGVPVYRGPRHAADLPLVLPLLGELELSRTVPADELLARRRAEEAARALDKLEEGASCELLIRGVKIGGSSRMKVLAEIMDAHRREDLRAEVERFFREGADIVDLGFGFDATPGDVARCFSELAGIEGPLAADTQDPALIRAALARADLVLSLHEGNIPVLGTELAEAGVAGVVIPGARTLGENLAMAGEAGIKALIADPILPPIGSGFTGALGRFRGHGRPLFFGAGNVAELLDADSVGANALLAGIAMELGAAVIFTSEHSDKTRGSVAEMRRATEMMALARERPYPKDLGVDLLVLKEKRRRREPPLGYGRSEEAVPMPREVTYDPCGNFRIGIEGNEIVAVHDGVAIRGRHWEDVLHTIISEGRVSRLDHAGYLGKELYKAELALRFGRSFEQDGEF
ncbi:MAG TPA: dihydropteroate synthase-like protein [Methanomicrobiales archaeon]|jgi:dihydropteroate synthase-like protein|nr:dihydropteroate synthase-like protein [Methanomicrobiales archaeon]